MSPYRGGWEPGDRSPPKTKQPPPKHGIKLKQIGASWWGLRWIAALELVLGAHSGRLARGRTYARAGRAHDLVVDKGKVTALVTGSRPAPYEVTIALGTLSPATWQRVVAGMVAKAQFAAELLSGQMPKELDEVFRAADTSLFPRDRADLSTSCSCPDTGDPCKHVAATHYVLGEALDHDPFLLFELRGRTKEQVLHALRAARADEGTASGKKRRTKPRAASAPDPSNAPLPPARQSITADDYDRPRQPLPALDFSFEAPSLHGALLRQLGSPPTWTGDISPAEALGGQVALAGERARRLALADEDDAGPSAATTSGPKAKP